MYFECMPTLQIREFPPAAYARLKARAAAEHRSLTQEAAHLLERTLDTGDDARARRQRIVHAARANPIPLGRGVPSPEDLVREDRER